MVDGGVIKGVADPGDKRARLLGADEIKNEEDEKQPAGTGREDLPVRHHRGEQKRADDEQWKHEDGHEVAEHHRHRTLEQPGEILIGHAQPILHFQDAIHGVRGDGHRARRWTEKAHQMIKARGSAPGALAHFVDALLAFLQLLGDFLENAVGGLLIGLEFLLCLELFQLEIAHPAFLVLAGTHGQLAQGCGAGAIGAHSAVFVSGGEAFPTILAGSVGIFDLRGETRLRLVNSFTILAGDSVPARRHFAGESVFLLGESCGGLLQRGEQFEDFAGAEVGVTHIRFGLVGPRHRFPASHSWCAARGQEFPRGNRARIAAS